MSTRTLLIAVLCNLVLNVHCAQQSSKSHIVPKTKAVKESEDIIEKLVRGKRIPGMAIVVTKKDSVIWKAGYGYADIKNRIPINPDSTFFRIASISKPMSAVGLTKMYQDGVIDINESIYKYVPDFPQKKYDFTVKQLATHTAGIRTYKGNEFLNTKFMTIKEGLRFFAYDTLMYQPGTGYLYNSNDWNLVAVAMEDASGMDFEKYMKEKVFTPLELTNIIADRREPIPGKAVFYTQSNTKRSRFRKAVDVNNYYKLASGGFLATASSVSDFGNKILYNYKSFLDTDSRRLMLTSQVVNAIRTYYGVGWEVSLDRKRRPYYGHIGNGVGGYGYFYVYPEEDMVFVILMNVTNPGISDQVKQIIDNMIEAYGTKALKTETAANGKN